MDPASEFDRCTIRLLKDHHIFSSSKCPREGGGGGGAFLHFMNLFLLLLSLVFYVIQSFNSEIGFFCKFQYLHAVKQNDNMYVQKRKLINSSRNPKGQWHTFPSDRTIYFTFQDNKYFIHILKIKRIVPTPSFELNNAIFRVFW